jgi:hypothetical protein
MLRNFHYIDDKGKDEGMNGEILEMYSHKLHPKLTKVVIQSAIALANSWRFSRM